MSFGGGVGGSSIAGSTDVVLSSPTNNQVLGYNSGTAKWQNQTVSGAATTNASLLTTGTLADARLPATAQAATLSSTYATQAEYAALVARVAALEAAAGTSPQWYSSLAPDATVSVAYSFTFVATGTPAPTFSITVGSLPPGLTLTSGGFLSGTPTTPGTYSYTITATNGVAPDIIRVKTLTVSGVGAGNMYNPAIYGSGVAFDCKGNVVINNAESMAMRFKAGASSTLTGIQWTQRQGGTGYSLGTGGTTTITIQTDNGSGLPSGTVLATTSWAGGNNPAGQENFDICTFSSPPSLTQGTIYYAVFENPSGTNYISANCGYTFDNHTNPKQPLFNDAEFGILLTTSYGGAWSKTINNAAGYTPVVDLIYANGYHDGQAYYENSGASGYYQTINGTANMVRESFTVSGGSRTVNSAGVWLRRHSGTNPLILTLETSGGTLIDTISIPAANVPISQPNGGNGGPVWVSGNFGATRTLTNGAAYNLRLSTASGTTYSIDPFRNASENYYGFQSWDFTDGAPYYTTNGSTWNKMAVSPYTAENMDIGFYLT